MNRLEDWKEIWERKGRQTQDLIAINGYDGGLGKMDTETYLDFTEVAKWELDLKDGDSLLDVGCGSGVMLLLLSASLDIKLAGIDYSEAHIEMAKKIVPSVAAKVSEAWRIPFGDGMFTKVLSCSVFQYFPNLDYATEVLLEMLRVTKTEGKVLVMDVPDLLKRKDARNHLYYTEYFFETFAKERDMNIRITDQDIPGYGNSPFRFNVLLWRKR